MGKGLLFGKKISAFSIWTTLPSLRFRWLVNIGLSINERPTTVRDALSNSKLCILELILTFHKSKKMQVACNSITTSTTCTPQLRHFSHLTDLLTVEASFWSLSRWYATLSNHYIQMERNYGRNAYWTSFLCIQMFTHFILCNYFSAMQKFYSKGIQYGSW